MTTAQSERDDAPNRRHFLCRVGGAMLLTGAGAALSACGKKDNPKPPSGDDAPFPRSYPAPD